MDLPLVIPHPVAGIALLLVLGRASPVGGALYAAGLRVASSPTGIVCAMLFVSAPLYVSAAREAFARVDARYESVARTLGDDAWRAFRRVTLPLSARGLTAAAVVMWARAVSEFGAIVILTYNPKVASVLSYDRFTSYGSERERCPSPRCSCCSRSFRSPRCARCARATSDPARSRAMISLQHVSARAGTFSLVDISFDVPQGAYGVVIGPAGAGKTTLLETIAGLVPRDVGQLMLGGDDLTHAPARARGARHRVPARLSLSASHRASERRVRRGEHDRATT